LLEIQQLPGQRGALGDEVGLADQALQIGAVEVRFLGRQAEHLAQVQEAHHLIEGIAVDQHAGVGAAVQVLDDLVPVIVQIDARHLVARHHDVLDGDVLQFEDAEQHGLMALGDHHPGLQHHRAQLFGAEGVLAAGGLDGDPEQSQQAVDHEVGQPNQRVIPFLYRFY